MKPNRWIVYVILAAAVLLVVFGGWRVYVSAFGSPDQFLRPGESDQVAGTDRAIANLEQLRDKAGPQGKERQQTEESLQQLRELRAKLAADRDARAGSDRRTEGLIGAVAIIAGIGLFGYGFRRLSRGDGPDDV